MGSLTTPADRATASAARRLAPGPADPAAPRAPASAVLQGLEQAARVRLGASADTAHELLHELAIDPSVTVRAAVAVNVAAPEQVNQLLAGDQDERVRSLLGRKLASLIPDMTEPSRNQLEGHVLHTLGTLVEDEATRVRAAIADVVKDMPAAPHELILRLARDSALPVSGPVIRLSPLLSAQDLLAVLASAPDTAIAAAVAERPGLPGPVADAIAAGPNDRLIAVLLANRSAAIREATLDALIARASEQPDWHDPLVRRPALSARAARALSEIVATELVAVLAARADLDPVVTQDLRRRIADHQQAARTTPTDPTLLAAMAQAQELQEQDRLDEAAVLAAARRGEARLCTAMLALAARLDVVEVDRAVTLHSTKAIISVIWSAGFSMRLAGPLQVLLCHVGPEAILRAGDGGTFPLTVEEMRWQLEFLRHIDRQPGRPRPAAGLASTRRALRD